MSEYSAGAAVNTVNMRPLQLLGSSIDPVLWGHGREIDRWNYRRPG